MRNVLFIILTLLTAAPVRAETGTAAAATGSGRNIVIVSTAADEREKEITTLKDEISRNKAIQERQIRSLQAEMAKRGGTPGKPADREMTGESGQTPAVDSDKGWIIQAADRGEAVFFKGIGEARMGRDNGKSVLRFTVEMAEKADRLFLPIRADRFARGKYVYYALDPGALAF